MEREAEAQDNRWRTRLDAVLMHRIWGSLIFLCIVYIIFFLSFAIGDPLVRLIQTGTQMFSIWACRMLEPWPRLQSLLGEGVVGGVGGVLAFLPNVVLLFGAITLLENSGYMMRVSRLMSRIMKIMHPSCWASAARFPPSCPPGGLKRATTAWSPSPSCP